MNLVFANQNEEDSIYPLTTREVVVAQQHDLALTAEANKEGYSTQLAENVKVICKGNKMGIPKGLQQCGVAWYHHYLQHPGTKCLKETLCVLMYQRGLRMTVQSHVKKCHSCKVKKC